MDLSFSSTFEELLDLAGGLDPADRVSKDIRLDNVSHDCITNVWYGSLTKIRMTNLPEKINHDNGILSPLPIEEDEGIAEIAAFLYDPVIRILLIQKSQYAPQISYLENYLQEKFASLPIDFKIVLNNDTLQKLQSMHILYRFELNAARLSPAAFASNASATAFLETLNTTNCYNADIKFSAKKGNPLAGWIKSFAMLLTGNMTEHVSRVKVGGFYENGKSDVLDLLNCKREETVRMNCSRTISFETRKSILATAYRKNKKDLYELYN